MANKKGKGSIYRRSDGLYIGRIMKNGVVKTVTSKNKKDVQDMLSAYSKQSEFVRDRKIRFADYVQQYLEIYKITTVKPATYDRLQSILKCQIRGTIIDVPLSKITDVLIQEYINSLVIKGLSRSTVSKVYELIKQTMTYAYRKKDIAVDISSIIKMPSSSVFPAPKQIETYTDDEKKRICDYINQRYYEHEDEKAFLRVAPAFILMFNTGLRMGEVLALTWDDIDMNNGIIHVKNTVSVINNRDSVGVKRVHILQEVKTKNSVRDVPLNTTAYVAIQELLKRNKEHHLYGDFIVSSPSGEFIQPRSFEKKLKDICYRANVPYKGVHAIRHTFATNLIEVGVQPKCVSELLGHSNVVFTLNRYVHPKDDEKRNALDLL